MSQANLQQEKNAYSRALSLVVVGYTLAVLGLVALLTINGQSAVPQFAQITTMVLIALGLLLPAAGTFWLKETTDQTEVKIRNSFALQGLGLITLLLGVAIAVLLSSLAGFLFGTLFLVISSILLIYGVLLVQKNHKSIGAKNRTITYLLIGTILLLSGVGLIIFSNFALYYCISQIENSVLTNVGATVSAYGCVVLAFSFFDLRKRNI